MKIVLAIDGSDCSLRAAKFLNGLIKGLGETEVHVVNVQHPVRYVDLLSEEKQQLVERLNREHGERETNDAREMLAEAGVPVHGARDRDCRCTHSSHRNSALSSWAAATQRKRTVVSALHSGTSGNGRA